MSSNKKPATHRFQPLPTGKKVFDVVRPGKSPALPNSRSVMMTSRPDATDGQFVPPSAPALPGAPAKVAKHPLTSEKEKLAPLKQPEQAVPPSAPPLKEQKPEKPEEPKQPAPQAPSVVMLSEIDAILGDGVAAEQPNEQPPAGKRLNIHVEQDVEVTAKPPTSDQAERTETQEPAPEAEPTPVEPAVKADVTASLAKPLTEEEIAAHLSHDELLANTTAPAFDKHEMVVSHHHHRMRVWQFLLILLLVIALALAAFNFLLDAEIVKTELDIPHTNVLQ